MALFNPPGLQAGRVEGFGTIPAYAIDDAATSRRIWKLRAHALVTTADLVAANSS
jgi:hypothetical protein